MTNVTSTLPVKIEFEQADWQTDLLRKVALLRQGAKPAILYLTSDGAILIFRAEPAGRISAQ